MRPVPRRRMPRQVLRALALAAALVVCAAAAKGSSRTVTVHIADMKFTPAHLVIHPGDTVVWQNDDLVPHSVVGGGFMSPNIPAGKTYRWTASQQGTFPYICTLHPVMKGQVTVKP